MTEEKKVLRKSFNFIAIVLIVYNILFDEVIFWASEAVYYFAGKVFTGMDNDALVDYVYFSGHSLIAAAVISVAAAFLMCREKPSFKVNRRIDFKTVISLFLIMQAIQAICSILLYPIMGIIYMFGGSTEEAIAAASSPSVYFSSLVYSIVIAPLFEELFIRGLILNKLKPYGKGFAVIISALIFGLIHINIVQFPVTFILGILFGVIALEYSLGAAILLHMLNNIYVELMGNLYYVSYFADIINIIIVIVSLIALGVLFVLNRERLKAYAHTLKPEKETVKAFFTAPLVIAAIVYFAVLTTGSITPL